MMAKRDNVTLQWASRFSRSDPNQFTSNIRDLHKLRTERAILDFLKNKIGLSLSIPTDEVIRTLDQDLIIQTKEVLNQFEHLAKLFAAKAVRKEDIQLYFHTAIAETFVLTLPFILYRRRKKPEYASSFQKLLSVAPHVSERLKEIQLLRATAHNTANTGAGMSRDK